MQRRRRDADESSQFLVDEHDRLELTNQVNTTIRYQVGSVGGVALASWIGVLGSILRWSG